MKVLIRCNSAIALAILQACGGGGGGGDTSQNLQDAPNGLFAKTGLEIESSAVPPETPSDQAPKLSLPLSSISVERGSSVSLSIEAESETALQAVFAKIVGTQAALLFPLENLSAATAKADLSLQLDFSISENFVPNQLCFDLSASDAQALVSQDETICLDIAQPAIPNKVPLLGAILAQQASPGEQVLLSISASDDGAGPLRFQWSQLQGPRIILSGANSANARFEAPQVAGETELVFQVTVTDEQGAFGTATAAVTVLVPNRPPRANAGQDQFVFSNESVQLSGSASDPDSDPLSFQWRALGGSSVQLSDASAQNPRFNAPVVSQRSFVSFEFTATDPQGASSQDQVVVVIDPPPASTATPAPTAVPTPAPTATPYGGPASPTPTPDSGPYGGPTPTPTPAPYGGPVNPTPTPDSGPYGGPTSTPAPYGGPTPAPVATSTPTPPVATPTPPVATPTPTPDDPYGGPYGGKLGSAAVPMSPVNGKGQFSIG